MKFRIPTALLASVLPLSVAAQRTLTVDIGTRMDLATIMLRILNFLAATIGIFCTVMFVVGGLMLTASRGEEWVQKAKELVVGSIFGLIVVLGSYAILRTVFYFLYVI